MGKTSFYEQRLTLGEAREKLKKAIANEMRPVLDFLLKIILKFQNRKRHVGRTRRKAIGTPHHKH